MGEAKHLRLRRELTGRLGRAHAGERLPSIRQLMREHGLSQATVTRSLDELAREGLIERRPGRGYFKAAGPSSSQGTSLVGVLVEDVGQRYGGLLVQAIEEELAREGLTVLLANTRDDPRNAIKKMEALEERGGGGFIVSPTTLAVGNPRYVRFLNDVVGRRIPLVLVNLAVPGVAANFVGIDYYGGFRAATEELLTAGVTRLGVSTVASSLLYAERFGGVAACVQDVGTVELHLLPSTWEASASEIAERTARLGLDGVMIAEGRASIAVAVAIRRRFEGEGRRIALGVLIEEGQPIPLEECVVVEKPTLAMGRRAVQVLLSTMRGHKKGVDTFEKLSMRIHRSSAPQIVSRK